MLKSIKCESLIKNTLKFSHGLNAVIGADDAHNSIGKSSILMLIDFVFSGDDFPHKCDDVINNVGDLSVYFTFEFDKSYSFIRNTKSPEVVISLDSDKVLTIDEFRNFLQEKYGLVEYELNFRECISAFFRIYQRGNYNEKNPLCNHSKETYSSIRKRILKLFKKYNVISELERLKTDLSNNKIYIKGAFNTGVVKKITKTQFNKNLNRISSLDSEIAKYKKALSSNVTDIKSILDKEVIDLKRRKDNLQKLRLSLEISASRIDANLASVNPRSSKEYNLILDFFPDVNTERLQMIDMFHSGISKIMRGKLTDEKKIIELQLAELDNDLHSIDDDLLKVVSSKEESLIVLEKIIDLDRERKDITLQNEMWEKNESINERIKEISTSINNALSETLEKIESTLNSWMSKVIKYMYTQDSIAPKIIFLENEYIFERGDDRGTGKGFANMIALDLSILYLTCLPCIIHDSLLFKNMDIPSVENLVKIYSRLSKQIFISIDEVGKYSPQIQRILQQASFIKLDRDNVAFGKKWKEEKRN